MQKEIQVGSQQRVDTLTRTLVDILDGLGVNMICKGGWRENNGPDFADHDILINTKKVGVYNFEKIGTQYKVTFDISQLDIFLQQKVETALQSQFPEVVKKEYAST